MSNIHVSNLSKKYKNHTILKNLEFQVEDGLAYVCGNLGTGKSTFVKICSGLERPDSGEVLFDGKKPFEAGSRIGLVHENPRLYMNFSGYGNMKIFNVGELGDGDRVEAILTRLGLGDGILYKKVKMISSHQQYLLEFAIAMNRKPEYLIMEEPAQGLEEEAWNTIITILSELMEHHKMAVVVIGNRYLKEFEKLNPNIIIFGKGETLFSGSILELTEGFLHKVELDAVGSDDLVENYLIQKGIRYSIAGKGHFSFEIAKEDLTDILAGIQEFPGIENLLERPYTLEEAYILTAGGRR